MHVWNYSLVYFDVNMCIGWCFKWKLVLRKVNVKLEVWKVPGSCKAYTKTDWTEIFHMYIDRILAFLFCNLNEFMQCDMEYLLLFLNGYQNFLLGSKVWTHEYFIVIAQKIGWTRDWQYFHLSVKIVFLLLMCMEMDVIYFLELHPIKCGSDIELWYLTL